MPVVLKPALTSLGLAQAAGAACHLERARIFDGFLAGHLWRLQVSEFYVRRIPGHRCRWTFCEAHRALESLAESSASRSGTSVFQLLNLDSLKVVVVLRVRGIQTQIVFVDDREGFSERSRKTFLFWLRNVLATRIAVFVVLFSDFGAVGDVGLRG